MGPTEIGFLGLSEVGEVFADRLGGAGRKEDLSESRFLPVSGMAECTKRHSGLGHEVHY